ncbi:hypothetical protein [Bacillus alkalicellulosilyticus]|uniref:hypothetical protein n=1 Tax=Alkalihalobacterium alkalicellulosilyticum TaxID=1912214 RepID=UPI0009961AF5|nr:hypothetical protein [Bacillus alkalicellulosilyticus]
MNHEKKEIRYKLEQELESYTFERKKNVLKKTHPKTFIERYAAWLDGKITIPVYPVCAALGVAFLLVSVPLLTPEQQDGKGELVDLKGSIYWSEMIEERLGGE